MPAVHGYYPRPQRVIMARKVRTAMGRTNAGGMQHEAESEGLSHGRARLPGVTSLEEQRRQRIVRQRDTDGELPGAIGHDPTMRKDILHKRELSAPAKVPDVKAEARTLRRRLRESYVKLIGGDRPQSAGAVQDQLESDCGIFVADDVAHELASLMKPYHRPADKPVELVLFQQVYGQLQLALEQKEKTMMNSLRQRVYDAEKAMDLEGGQQQLSLSEIRSAMAEFGIAEDTMLDVVIRAFDRESGSTGHMTFGQLRSAIAGIKDPSSPFSKAGWRDKLSKTFEEAIGNSSNHGARLSRDQKDVYSFFLDSLMPSLQEQVDFMHPTAAFVRRRKSGTGKRLAPPKSHSAEPGIFGGPAFRMPTIAESGSAPVMRLADVKSVKSNTEVSKRDSMNAILKGLPLPKPNEASPTRNPARPDTQSSSASSCWSEFRERKSPFRAPKLSMDKLLRADEMMFTEEQQWQTVSQLEVNEPGSGLAGEKAKLKASEDRFFQKMENFKKLRDNVDGRAHADLEKHDKRYENRLSNMAEIRGSLQAKVQQQRDVAVGLGNVLIPSGVLDHQPKFRPAQIFEGPAMDAKRKQREEREQILRERRSLNEMKEDEKLALQAKREAERLLVIRDKQAKDQLKEQEREEYLLEREARKLAQDAERKNREGWSIDNALKGLKSDVAPGCEMIPDGFTQDTMKEDRRLNGVMRQDLRYDVAVAAIRKHNDQKRSRITKLLWGENPSIDLPGAVLEYVSPPKKTLLAMQAGAGPVGGDGKGTFSSLEDPPRPPKMEERGSKGGERKPRADTADRGTGGDTDRDGGGWGRWGRGGGGSEIERGQVATGGRESRQGGLFGGGGGRNGGRDRCSGGRISRLDERDSEERVGFVTTMTHAQGECGRGTPGPDRSFLFQKRG